MPLSMSHLFPGAPCCFTIVNKTKAPRLWSPRLRIPSSCRSCAPLPSPVRHRWFSAS